MTKPEGPAQEPQRKRMMRLPPNSNYPGYVGAHTEDDWCAKAGCIPMCVPATPAPSQRSKQVPERTISDECKYCAEGEPEWSTDASCWIHRRPQLDKRCTRKTLSPIGEFPAPSQQPCKRCSGTGVVRPAADNCPRCGGTGIEPASSQPAGAREWFMARRKMDAYISFDDMEEYAQFVTRQQIAAKDAELKACWNQLCDIGFMFDVVTPENNLRLAEIVKHKKEAAVRERDSLREANARLAADLDAALKAGKD